MVGTSHNQEIVFENSQVASRCIKLTTALPAYITIFGYINFASWPV